MPIDRRPHCVPSHGHQPRFAKAFLALALMALCAAQAPARAEGDTPPQSPRDVHQAFAAAFNARDVDRMLALYEPGAAVVPEPGIVFTGEKDLRDAMKGYLAMPGEMRIETLSVIEAGDIALTRSRWETRLDDKVTASASGAEVMRRGSDGMWRLIIDNPYGAEPVK